MNHVGDHRGGAIDRRRLLRAGGVALGAVAAARALRPGRAAAHQLMPVPASATARDRAVRIPDADIALLSFGTLPAGQTQYLVLERPASGRLRARALVATRNANLRLNPWLALVGPGLPRPDGFADLLGPGEGALLAGAVEGREVEVFPELPYPVLVGAALDTELPADGPYYLLIFDPGGQSGAYVIDTGFLLD